MPVYEYECERCGCRFDRLTNSGQRDHAGPCPECGDKKLHRVPSVIAAATGREERAARDTTLSPDLCGRCGRMGPCMGG